MKPIRAFYDDSGSYLGALVERTFEDPVDGHKIERIFTFDQIQSLPETTNHRMKREPGWDGRDFFTPGSMVSGGERRRIAPDAINGKATFPPPDLDGAYQPSGTFEAWCAAATKAMTDRPRVCAMLYASLASPLIPLLGSGGFSFSVLGTPSTGKTTALALAASCWGDPSRLIRSWNEPVEDLLAASGRAGCLPFFLDECVGIGYRSGAPAEVLEALVRSRKEGGLLATSRCTAEHYREAQIRPSHGVALFGFPWQETSPKAASLVTETAFAIQDHHGHAGITFLARLQTKPGLIDRMREAYRSNVVKAATLAGSLGACGAAGARSMALLFTVGQVIRNLMPELGGEPPEKVLESLWEWLRISDGSDSEAIIAMYAIKDWMRENRHRIFGMRREPDPPSDGWIGKWDATRKQLWITLAIARSIVQANQIKWDKVFEEWKDARMLALDGKTRKPIVRKSVGIHVAPCISFDQSL